MTKKKVVEQKSPEQLLEELLQRKLAMVKENLVFIPEPTYSFKIQEKVLIGNLKDCIIEEVLENGKIYKIDYTDINNNYGNPIIKEHQKNYFRWIDIRKINHNTNSFIKNNDLKLDYSQRQITDLFGKTYSFGVNFEPEYQREFVWELEDKVSLIDSIFNNVDIGKFVFIKNNYGKDFLYEILDGKQRVRAILDFYEDRFQYKECYYSDLSWEDQTHIKNYLISIAEVSDITREQILKYFIALNTGGKPMAKEQLDKVKKMLEE